MVVGFVGFCLLHACTFITKCEEYENQNFTAMAPDHDDSCCDEASLRVLR